MGETSGTGDPLVAAYVEEARREGKSVPRSSRRRIPVYRARLPRAEKLLKYLSICDEARWYTNRGELVCELEQRLNSTLGQPGPAVAVTATGSAALEAAILAAAGRASRARPLALIPAYTFVATALAVERCGYTPYEIDVDAETWAIAPDPLLDHPMLARTGLVVPVAPYGRAVAQEPWRQFGELTRVPVVIDGAASFDAMTCRPDLFTGPVPVALSFQTTKAFSTGEGGAVVWTNVEGLLGVAQAVNFGFLGTRETTSSGTNGRMSEYHAAVGLAMLDEWAERRQGHLELARLYRRMAAAHALERRWFTYPDVAANYALFEAKSPAEASALIEALTAEEIEHRFWYGMGLSSHAYFSWIEGDDTPVTRQLAPRLIGLPIYEDIDTQTIELVMSTLARVRRRDTSPTADLGQGLDFLPAK
jgi:dTDP-4-amino-4,6-dideoxygalactose transaminase